MSLIKTKLSVADLYQLEAEINGVYNQEEKTMIFKGLLQQDVSIKSKYWLSRLAEKVGSIKKIVDTLRKSLFEKYGQEKDGQWIVPGEIEEILPGKKKAVQMVPNPKLAEFTKEMEALSSEEHEIEHAEFNIDDFDFKSDENYRVFYKLLYAEEKAAA